MAALSEPVARQYRLNDVTAQRGEPQKVAAGNTLLMGAFVCWSTAGGTVEIPVAAALKAIAGVIVDGPANGDASFTAGGPIDPIVSWGGAVLLTITDVLTTTNAQVPVYATSDNDFTISKPASAIAIIGHIKRVTKAGEAWVLLDLAEVNP